MCLLAQRMCASFHSARVCQFYCCRSFICAIDFKKLRFDFSDESLVFTTSLSLFAPLQGSCALLLLILSIALFDALSPTTPLLLASCPSLDSLTQHFLSLAKFTRNLHLLMTQRFFNRMSFVIVGRSAYCRGRSVTQVTTTLIWPRKRRALGAPVAVRRWPRPSPPAWRRRGGPRHEFPPPVQQTPQQGTGTARQRGAMRGP